MSIATYDPKCFELAAAFLRECPEINTPRQIGILASEIQSTIEQFIDGEMSVLGLRK